MKNQKLIKILNRLKPVKEQRLESFDTLDRGVLDLTNKLKQEISAKSLDEVNSEINKFRSSLDLNPLVKSVEQLKGETSNIKSELSDKLEERHQTLLSRVAQGIQNINNITNKTEELLAEVQQVKSRAGNQDSALKQLSQKAETYKSEYLSANKGLSELIKGLDTNLSGLKESIKAKDKSIADIESNLEKFQLEIKVKLSQLGGGSANMQVNVKSSVMSSKYTDINFTNGGGINWASSDDDTNKRVNISASIVSSGGGSPGGNDTEIQFNNAGSFGGASVLTWNGSTSILALGGTFQLNGGTSGNVKVIAASVAGNWTMTLPPTDGSANHVLTTDGNGITVWASVAATGGSGITRTSSIITDNTVGDSTASIDRVYIANDGLCFTLPDASSNLNRYTVKNVTSSVLVTAVGGDTIDGSGSVLMALPNLSHDFISDNSNWHII